MKKRLLLVFKVVGISVLLIITPYKFTVFMFKFKFFQELFPNFDILDDTNTWLLGITIIIALLFWLWLSACFFYWLFTGKDLNNILL